MWRPVQPGAPETGSNVTLGTEGRNSQSGPLPPPRAAPAPPRLRTNGSALPVSGHAHWVWKRPTGAQAQLGVRGHAQSPELEPAPAP